MEPHLKTQIDYFVLQSFTAMTTNMLNFGDG